MMLFKVAAAAMSIDEVVSGTVADATALRRRAACGADMIFVRFALLIGCLDGVGEKSSKNS